MVTDAASTEIKLDEEATEASETELIEETTTALEEDEAATTAAADEEAA